MRAMQILEYCFLYSHYSTWHLSNLCKKPHFENTNNFAKYLATCIEPAPQCKHYVIMIYMTEIAFF